MHTNKHNYAKVLVDNVIGPRLFTESNRCDNTLSCQSIVIRLHTMIIYMQDESILKCFKFFCFLGDPLSINHLRQTTSPPGVLSFTWDPLSITDCPSLHYNIITTAESCGSCPTSVSSNTTATCINVQRGRNCTISVSVDLCGNQIKSNSITVSTGNTRNSSHSYCM